MRRLFHKLTYDCDRARDFMYDYLEENLPALTAIRFQFHLNGCRECREYLFLYRKAAHAKEFRREHFAPGAFLEATMDFLRREGITADEREEGPGP